MERRDFNTPAFKEWLVSLKDTKPDVKFCKKSNDITDAYYYLHSGLKGSITVWHNTLIEELIIDQETKETLFYLHYEMESCEQIKELVKNFKKRMFCMCSKEHIVYHDTKERDFLVCCSSGLTSSLIADLLKEYSLSKALPYSFEASSIYDQDALKKDYDLVLVAPQVGYKIGELSETYCQKYYQIHPIDFAEYNSHNIVSMLQESL